MIYFFTMGFLSYFGLMFVKYRKQKIKKKVWASPEAIEDCKAWSKPIEPKYFPTYRGQPEEYEVKKFSTNILSQKGGLKHGRNWENNVEKWYDKGVLHQKFEPAVIHPDGKVEYWYYGELHCLDGPAIIWPDGTEEWYKEGKRHRNRYDGPAIIFPWSSGSSYGSQKNSPEFWEEGEPISDPFCFEQTTCNCNCDCQDCLDECCDVCEENCGCETCYL